MRKIILSRTDSIGDVVLTLPMAGVLKELLPESHIIILGRDYTRDVAECSVHIDEFISWDDISKLKNDREKMTVIKNTGADTIIHVFPDREIVRLAKKAGIGIRIGTTGRIFHYLTCNRLVRFSRRRSNLHEAQLNMKLLRPLGMNKELSLQEIVRYYGLENKPALPEEFKTLTDPDRINLILHPKSKGSAREWGLENFRRLTELLDKNRYKIFITGTESEGELIRPYFKFDEEYCLDLTGKMSLQQLIAFIDHTDSLVAASTGPLHIAAALGKVAVGIYPPIRPMHPGRWAPMGVKASYLVLNKECDECRSGGICRCMLDIKPAEVIQKLEVYFGT